MRAHHHPRYKLARPVIFSLLHGLVSVRRSLAPAGSGIVIVAERQSFSACYFLPKAHGDGISSSARTFSVPQPALVSVPTPRPPSSNWLALSMRFAMLMYARHAARLGSSLFLGVPFWPPRPDLIARRSAAISTASVVCPTSRDDDGAPACPASSPVFPQHRRYLQARPCGETAGWMGSAPDRAADQRIARRLHLFSRRLGVSRIGATTPADHVDFIASRQPADSLSVAVHLPHPSRT